MVRIGEGSASFSGSVNLSQGKPSGRPIRRLFYFESAVQQFASGGVTVNFPNIAYAAGVRGLAQYQLALAVSMSESRLSRCLNGRFEFSPMERRRIAEVLSFDESWLFERPKPPKSRIFEGEATPALA
jgi:hypothetical protein